MPVSSLQDFRHIMQRTHQKHHSPEHSGRSNMISPIDTLSAVHKQKYSLEIPLILVVVGRPSGVEVIDNHVNASRDANEPQSVRA